MLEWFFLIMYNEHTLSRSTNLNRIKKRRFLIKKKSLADAQYLLILLLEVTIHNPVNFWTVTSSTYASFLLEFFRKSLLKPYLRKALNLVILLATN